MPGSADGPRDDAVDSEIRSSSSPLTTWSWDSLAGGVNHGSGSHKVGSEAVGSTAHTNENRVAVKVEDDEDRKLPAHPPQDAAALCWVRETNKETHPHHHNGLEAPPQRHWSEDGGAQAVGTSAAAHVEQQERHLCLFSDPLQEEAEFEANNNTIDTVSCGDDEEEEDVETEGRRNTSSPSAPTQHPPQRNQENPPRHQEEDEDDWYREDGVEYMNEEEEEALQQLLMMQQEAASMTQLTLANDLANLSEDTLDRLQYHHHQHPQIETLHFDRVALRVRPAAPVVQEQDEQEEDDDSAAIPDLHSESSHASAVMVLEQLEEALAVNGSLTHVALAACHPKVAETVLWGLSCGSGNSRLQHLALELWNDTTARRQRRQAEDPDNRSHKYLVWEGLIELLKQTQTLSTLYVGNSDNDEEDDDTTNAFWPMLCHGISQNTTLTSLSIETLLWSEEATKQLAQALSHHPILCHSEFVCEDPERRPTLITIRCKAAATAEKEDEEDDGVIPLEDSTNQSNVLNTDGSPKRAKLAKAVSEDTSAVGIPFVAQP